LLKAEVPGVSKEDVHLELEDGVLTITGERKQTQEHKDERFHRVETSYGSFMRRFSVPDDASPDGIKANYKDGMLTITLKKLPPEKKQQSTKRIPVS